MYDKRKWFWQIGFVLIILIPYLEKILMLTILIVGLSSIDFYHIVFLLIVIAILTVPSKRYIFLRILMYFLSSLILVKYFFSLLILPQNTIELFESLGFLNDNTKKNIIDATEQRYFE